jgi:hypothetical protein
MSRRISLLINSVAGTAHSWFLTRSGSKSIRNLTTSAASKASDMMFSDDVALSGSFDVSFELNGYD